jgi:hypothetical protein
VSLEDTAGLKARAWHDRFVIRDIIDLHAVAGTFSYADLENLALHVGRDFPVTSASDCAEPAGLPGYAARYGHG